MNTMNHLPVFLVKYCTLLLHATELKQETETVWFTFLVKLPESTSNSLILPLFETNRADGCLKSYEK